MPTYDLSTPITADTPVFLGDPIFQSSKLQSLDKGDSCNLCHLQMSNHMGTHIDFPAHVIKGGKTSSDFPIDALVGSGVILEYEANSSGGITKEFIQQQQSEISRNRFIFFKTPSHITPVKPIHIEEEAAKELVQQGVKVVGVDSLSVDPLEADDLPTHHVLLSHDVLIVEGLNLKDIPPGEGEIIIAPLNIPNMDGLPARVIMRR